MPLGKQETGERSRPRAAHLLAKVLVAATIGCSDDDHADHAKGANHGHDASDPLAHCRPGYEELPDPHDELIADEPVRLLVRAGRADDPSDDVYDVAMPAAVIDWMFERGWQQEHDDWHNIRRWDQGCRRSNAPASGCASAERLVARGLWRAPIQEGAPGDGYDFLVMHRHMIETIRKAFPRHPKLFAGFARVPRSQDDAENPNPQVEVRWSASQLEAIDKLEQIERHLDEFPSEDELALYMQAPFRWTPENPSAPRQDGAGIHFSLHAQWSIAGSSALLGNGLGVIDNFVFWKLHGWLDDVWERYRRAKGIGANDPKYVAAMQAQCEEMHALDELNLKPPEASPADAGAPVERGTFVERVKPAFDAKCVPCHGPVGPSAALTLGGQGVSTSMVVRGLVGVKATNGPYDLVVPGDPMRSWLYLKASGEASGAVCERACIRGPMPPAGVGLSADELAALRQWILDGAAAPQ